MVKDLRAAKDILAGLGIDIIVQGDQQAAVDAGIRDHNPERGPPPVPGNLRRGDKAIVWFLAIRCKT
jgi:hypothetical protein